MLNFVKDKIETSPVKWYTFQLIELTFWYTFELIYTRPKGLSEKAQRKALYKEGQLSVVEICQNLSMSKVTLYKYLRHQGIEVSTFHKQQQTK